MYRFFATVLLLSSVLAYAQTSTKGQDVALEARNEAANALPAPAAALPASDVYATLPARPVTTGVTVPKLIAGPKIMVASSDFKSHDMGNETMVVRFKVDRDGTTKDFHIVKSVNPKVNMLVMQAVSQYRYEPAVLDEQPVPVQVNLKIRFQ